MKKRFTFYAALFAMGLFCAQDGKFDLLEKSTETKILYDRVFPVADATNLQGKTLSANNFLQLYSEMQRADFLQRLPVLSKIQQAADEGFAKGYVPLSVLIADFESVAPEAYAENKLKINSKEQLLNVDNSTGVFHKSRIALLGNLLPKSKERKVQFMLRSDLLFNVAKRSLAFIEIEDGKNWKRIEADQIFTLNFRENGFQTVNYKIHFVDGTVLSQTFSIDIQYQPRAKAAQTFMPNVVTTISSTIPYKGYGESAAFTGLGEYEVFLDTVNGVLDKPIILVDGFDPGDARNTTAIYQMLNYGTNQNLGDMLRAQGFDVIVLNFPKYTRPDGVTVIDGGVDFIQRNAFILAELLKTVNQNKVGTEKNVIIGPSMGGLISRYALRYMEQNSLSHESRLFISFDSPHLGANVPIGFQHLFNYMAYGPLGDVTMQEVVNGMLKSPAAKQMLLDHLEAHLKSGSATDFDPAVLLPAGAPNFRTAFQTELNAMGFPQTVRNVAIANGAGNSTMTGTPGMVVLDHTFNTSSTQRAIIKLNFTPVKNQTLEVSRFRGQQWIFTWITLVESAASSRSTAGSDGLDSAPGGRFDIGQFGALAQGNAMLTEFLDNLKIKYFDFIPTLSSLALSGVTDYYAPVTASSVSPFAAYSVPAGNENHVTLTAQNVQFALNEILSETLATSQNQVSPGLWIENPVRSSLRIKSTQILKDAQIIISDMAGRKVFHTTATLSGEVTIPMKLSKGVYFLKIYNESVSKTQKVVVE